MSVKMGVALSTDPDCEGTAETLASIKGVAHSELWVTLNSEHNFPCEEHTDLLVFDLNADPVGPDALPSDNG